MGSQTPKAGQLLALSYLGVNLLALALCLFTLGEMWAYRPMLHLMFARIPIVNLFGGLVPMWALFVLLALATLTGFITTFRLLWAWRVGDTIPGLASRLRAAFYLGMACLFVCIFVLSTPESFSGPFRLRHPIAGWITASIACGLWWLLPRLRFGLSDRALRRIDLVAMNVCLTLVLAELTLRGAAMVWASPLLVTDSTSSQIRRQSERMAPGTDRFSFPINSQGFYDTEFLPPGERSRPLVVTIGDSFSYGVVPHHFHYTTVAEREYDGAEIYNIGFPGTNPTDYLYHVKEDALPLEPDLIVISLFVGNDLFPEPPSVAPIRWYDAERYLLGVVWHRLQILRHAKADDWTRNQEDTSSDDLVERYPWLADPLLEPPSLGEEIYLELEARNAYLGAAEHKGAYGRFFAALHRIENAAGDVPVAFMLIPSEYQVNDALWDVVVERNQVPMQRDLPQQKILEWAAEGNRDVLDLLPLMRAVPPLSDGQRHLYHLRDGHFNARGNAVAGRALAGLIAQKLSAATDAGVDTDITLPDPRRAGTMSVGEATVIVETFAALIGEIGVNGKTVYAESALGRSKQEIKTAIVIVVNGDVSAAQPNFYRELASILAFFQPEVGSDGVSIDAVRADQSTWRPYIEAEMRENAHYVVSKIQR